MEADSGTPVEVGLVGAGPWAATMHGPVLAAGPQTRLAAVWARRGEAAARLAGRLGTHAAVSYEELLERCEAVAFAVPPDVQAALAPRAARAGKALLLEKPLALDLGGARALADAVAEHGVVTQLVLTKRYHPSTRAFLAAAAAFEAAGARTHYLHGAFLGGAMATGWRLTLGALYDLGPHLLDLADAALGPIEEVRAAGDSRRWIELTCRHRHGAVSQMSLSGAVGLASSRAGIELFGPAGTLALDFGAVDHGQCWPVLRAEFAAAVRSGVPHPLDVRRGLMLQELLDRIGRTDP
ncbi:Gfo/Idh/MocA family oxidoreductase [Actinoplanes sp. NEAU-A12]|uniref:Gfo/Idh/MocA family oxidoreductase n=1 Tax=Actinoplanes sandaracinus TaxID=3045177 RepID=A0ABT6WGE9_9ACTN|nr:Gfo/Idh/MocA family oxidoreductase [Actinoplanes sandaracinus]MDI6098805.1 Gfo/Idh/MocA family oxidoreductase [Actinoplanes sandaracinus]